MGGSGMLASATSYDSVAIGVTVVATVVVVLLIAAVVALLGAARDLRRETEELRRQGQALLIDLDGTVAHAADDLNRVDGLIGSAERLTATVGSATGMTRAAWASPVIKVMALGTGTARASERWRGRRQVRGR